MSSLFFWRTWPHNWRRLWYTIAPLFVISMCFMWFSWFQGTSGVIDWETIQEQKEIETVVHTFRLGPFELTIPAQSYVVFEYLQGSGLHHNTTASYVFLACFLFAAMVLLTVFTSFDGFWYFAGMGAFIAFVISLRLDALAVFGLDGLMVPSTVMLLFLFVGFYFKKIRPEIPFATRLAVFVALMASVVAIVYFFAEVPFPLLYLAMASYTPGMVISVLFIIMVGHEIMASFVYIAGQGKSKTLRHFLIISAVYLVNVFITCLHEIGAIGWDFIYINLYLLLTLSAMLGLWGFKLREDRYGNIFAFAPLGAFYFVALGAICFATVGQLLGNANDAALKVIRDFIIFSHAAFGLIFLTYVFANFAVMMAYNKPPYKVLYRPNRMPYFTFRLAGVIAMLAFVFVTHWSDYVNHSLAGFYNYAGDLYIMQGNEAYGRALYERSRLNAFQNHRANYALAMIKASRIDFEKANENFDLANGKRPSDYSLVNQGNLFLWRQAYFPAIEIFRNALRIQPSPALYNNIGFAYAKVHNLDSALHYMNLARESPLTKVPAETNFLAMTASELLPIDTDSVLNYFKSDAPAVRANALAMTSLFDQQLKAKVDPLTDKALNLHTATLLNNYLIANAHNLDTAQVREAYRIANDSLNFGFYDMLKAAVAHVYYHQGNVYRAQEIMAELAFLSHEHRGTFNYVMGLWSLEQGNPNVAEVHFSYAGRAEYKNAKFYRAIALTEAQRIAEARVAWDSVGSSADEGQRRLASRMNELLTVAPEAASSMPDPDKYQFTRYRLNVQDTAFFSRLVDTFESQDYKGQALLDMARKLYRAGDTESAIRYYNRTAGLRLTNERLYNDIRHFELLMLASRNEVRSLAQQIGKGIEFDDSDFLEKTLFTALIDLASGDSVKAEKNFQILASWNPFFEEGILAASEYYRATQPDSFKAYEVLAEAIQVNTHSRRILTAYVSEALRKGFDEYAAAASERLNQLP